MNVPIYFFLIAFGSYGFAETNLSINQLCADEKCLEPISSGRTLIAYNAPEPWYLSFHPNDKVQIFSKDAGSDKDLFGVELNGKRGYVPKRFVKEDKIFHRAPTFVVSTVLKPVLEVPSTSETEKIVIDGTTLYDDISPSTVQQEHVSNPSTAMPQPFEHKPQVTKAEFEKGAAKIFSSEDAQQTADKMIGNMANVNAVSVEDDDDMEIDDEDDDDDDDDDDEDEDEEDNNEDKEKEQSEDVNTVKQPVVVETEKKLITENEIPIEFKFVNNLIETDKSKINIETELPMKHTDHNSHGIPHDNHVKLDSGVLHTTTEAPTVQTPTTKLPLFFHDSQVPTGDVLVSESPPTHIENVELEINSTSKSEESVPLSVQENLDIPERIEKDKLHMQTTPSNATSAPLNLDTIGTNIQNKGETIFESVPVNVESSPLMDTNQNIVTDKQPEVITESLDVFEAESSISEDGKLAEEVKLSATTEMPVLIGMDTKSNEPSNIEISTCDDDTQSDVPNESETIHISDQRNSVVNDTLPETPPKSDYNVDPSYRNTGDEVQLPEPTQEIYEQLPTEPTDSVMPSNVESIMEMNTVEDIPETNEGYWYSSLLTFFKWTTDEESIYINNKAMYTGMKDEEVSEGILSSHFTSLNNRDSCPADNEPCHVEFPHSASEYHPDTISSKFSNSEATSSMSGPFDTIVFNDTFMIVAISGACIVLFLWGYMLIEKMRKEGPLVGKINHLEQQLLILAKENEVLCGRLEETKATQQEINENVSSDLVHELQRELDDAQKGKLVLEEQVQSLEKELEISTEVGLELNKMLSEVLNSQNGSDTVMANIEQLQKQLVEQQATINTVNEKLNEKDTENHELQLDLEINTKKVVDLQAELEKMMLNQLKTEEENEMVVSKTEGELKGLREQLAEVKAANDLVVSQLTKQLEEARAHHGEAQRNYELKAKEYNLLKDGLTDSDANKNILEQSALKAELQQLQVDNKSMLERLGHEQIIGKNFQGEVQRLDEEKTALKKQYEEADKEKLEALTKLEVLSTYFKEKEAELQRELTKHETMWSEKQGETTSTSERMKFMQEEIQNFKLQVASLQQEIVSQEVDLKSQISVLEKKAHENWVAARQAERRIEDARQEAAQLRNRLTLRERSLLEDKSQTRNGISPLESNGGDHLLNDNATPPLLFGSREHMTTSPPLLPGLPPGFALPPPPPGVPPFLPHFMPPPPPAMYPGDHRPPPLGRMSSPPANNRYTPDSRAFSPYDRRSPSPTDDEYYDRYDRDYYNNRSSKRSNGRRSGYSSGSISNESLDKLDRSHSHSKV